MKIEEFLKNINWELLRKQKTDLIMLTPLINKDVTESIDGIINFIDEFQDMAVEYLDEETVYGIT